MESEMDAALIQQRVKDLVTKAKKRATSDSMHSSSIHNRCTNRPRTASACQLHWVCQAHAGLLRCTRLVVPAAAIAAAAAAAAGAAAIAAAAVHAATLLLLRMHSKC